MGFESVLNAVVASRATPANVVDKDILTYVLRAVYGDLSNNSGGDSSLPIGGTTGQALVKSSNVDGAVSWSNPFLSKSGGQVTGALEYAEDYSNTFTGQSLVDVDYVDNILSNITNDYLSVNGNNSMQGDLFIESYSINGYNLNINFDSSVIQESNGTGLVYEADYSSSYTSRSLVDKEYVDNAIAAAIAAIP